MDKQFWQEVILDDCEPPDEFSLDELTEELFSYLCDPDPDLRDDIGYVVYANWLEMGLYDQDEINEHIDILFANAGKSIGESESDSIFLRSFSILFLSEIVHNDNKSPGLDKDRIQEILEKGLTYLESEKDPRGYVQEKGWAHALAHTADLLRELAKNEHTGLLEHKQILNSIATKLINATDWIYVHGEDDRLSAVALSIFRRGMLPISAINEWLESLSTPKNNYWKGAWTDEEGTRAFFNVRNFLRSLYVHTTTQDELSNQDALKSMLMETIQNLQPF